MAKAKNKKSVLNWFTLVIVLLTVIAFGMYAVFGFINVITTPEHYSAYHSMTSKRVRAVDYNGLTPKVTKVTLHNLYIGDTYSDNYVIGMSDDNRQYKLSPLFYYPKDYQVPKNRVATVYVTNKNSIALMNDAEKAEAEHMSASYENSIWHQSFVIARIIAFVLGGVSLILIMIKILVMYVRDKKRNTATPL